MRGRTVGGCARWTRQLRNVSRRAATTTATRVDAGAGVPAAAARGALRRLPAARAPRARAAAAAQSARAAALERQPHPQRSAAERQVPELSCDRLRGKRRMHLVGRKGGAQHRRAPGSDPVALRPRRAAHDHRRGKDERRGNGRNGSAGCVGDASGGPGTARPVPSTVAAPRSNTMDASVALRAWLERRGQLGLGIHHKQHCVVVDGVCLGNTWTETVVEFVATSSETHAAPGSLRQWRLLRRVRRLRAHGLPGPAASTPAASTPRRLHPRRLHPRRPPPPLPPTPVDSSFDDKDRLVWPPPKPPAPPLRLPGAHRPEAPTALGPTAHGPSSWWTVKMERTSRTAAQAGKVRGARQRHMAASLPTENTPFDFTDMQTEPLKSRYVSAPLGQRRRSDRMDGAQTAPGERVRLAFHCRGETDEVDARGTVRLSPGNWLMQKNERICHQHHRNVHPRDG